MVRITGRNHQTWVTEACVYMANDSQLLDEDGKILDDLKDFISTSNAHHGPMIDRIVNDLAFASSEQFGEDDSAIRGNGRAKVTINLVRNYCNQIINRYRTKPYGIVLNPRKQSVIAKTELTQGIVRGIESVANAQQAYTIAIDRQVKGGRGYVAVTTDYESETGFDQSLKMTGIIRPDMVIWDEFSTEVDGSDATRCAFVEHISKSRAKDFNDIDADYTNSSQVLLTDTRWAAPEGSVEVVTYFKVSKAKTKIFMDDDGNILQENEVRKNSKLRSRVTTKTSVIVSKFVNGEIVSSTELPIKCLPVVPFLGEMVDLPNRTDWVGIPFFAHDAQQLVNQMASLTAERIALGLKPTVYVDPEAIEDYLDLWQQGNKLNLPFLPIRTFDANGKPYNPPTPSNPAANITDVTTAQGTSQQNLSSILGMPEAGVVVAGAPNETATAVLTRSKSADMSNFQYMDNAQKSIKQLARVLLQMIPVIYDVDRMVPVHDGKVVMGQPLNIADMGIVADEFDVDLDAGPMVATQRKEEFQSLIALAGILGPDVTLTFAADIVANADFSNADEISKKISQYANTKLGLNNGGAPDPQAEAALQQASQTVKTLQQHLQEVIAQAQASKAQDGQEMQQMGAYIQQLQSALEANKEANATKIAVAQIQRETRVDVESLKEQGKLTDTQLKIQADAEKDARSALLKSQEAQAEAFSRPILNVEGQKPEMNAVDGMRSQIFRNA
jgi:hypothetical protein